MPTYLLLAENGSRPPEFRHNNYHSACSEALRLAHNLSCKVEVLEVVASVEDVEVPVTKTQKKLIEFAKEDDIPF